MKGGILAVAMLLFGAIDGGVSAAQMRSGIDVEAPWARATPGGAQTGAAYMEILNKGPTADRLLGATTPVARTVQFHSVTEENGISRMHEMPAIDIAPGASVVFKPGGMHMMLVGLKGPLKEGETIRITLEFRQAGRLDVDLPVGRVGAMHSPAMQHEHGGQTGR